MLQDSDTQVAHCCRAIVRGLRRQGLKPGDRLPAQEALRQRLGFSHNSLTPAMNLLVASGLLARRRGVGSVVVNLDAEPAGLWRFGLALGALDHSPSARFGALLGRYLHEHIQRAGCLMRSYLLNTDKTGVLPHGLGDFGMLAADIEAGRVDGVISSAFFSTDAWQTAAQHEIALVNVGGWPDIPLRVEMDVTDLLEQAASALASANRSRIAVIAESATAQAYAEALRVCLPECTVSWIAGVGETDAARVVDALLATPEAERPDGLLVANDTLTLALTSMFSRTQYAPFIVAQTNQQISLPYLLPVVAIDLDLEALAARGIFMLLAAARCPTQPPYVELVRGSQRHIAPLTTNHR